MVVQFTHTVEMDWILPGIAPTGKRVEVALVVIVHFRDGKLAHEHIYWDQASVLAQLGLIDAAKLPVAGVESAEKVLHPKLPSNTPTSRLRRDLGTLESYAALIGILIGAGIFQVTSQAWAITGPSVILGYIILTPAILAT